MIKPLPRTVLIDAGPLIALFDRSDHYHQPMLDFLTTQRLRFVSTLAVVTEVAHMLDFSVNAQLDFFRWVAINGVQLFDIQQTHIARVIELTERYADLPMDLADATLVIAAESTGIRDIISIDSDFDVYRLPGRVAIHNIFSGSAPAQR
ncbi:pilus biogenesis protein [Betaproteobacteria bacterium]|nr:pilus biogenesis protein [Betaproteobacteria bacterium]